MRWDKRWTSQISAYIFRESWILRLIFSNLQRSELNRLLFNLFHDYYSWLLSINLIKQIYFHPIWLNRCISHYFKHFKCFATLPKIAVFDVRLLYVICRKHLIVSVFIRETHLLLSYIVCPWEKRFFFLLLISAIAEAVTEFPHRVSSFGPDKCDLCDVRSNKRRDLALLFGDFRVHWCRR